MQKTESKAELRQIEYSKLMPSKTNPRKDFNKGALEELAASIREHGVKQPLIVRPIAGGKFEIVGGERRYRASGIVKLEQVPCMVEEMDDKTALEIQAIENLQREDLNPIEEAQGYKQLQSSGYTIDELIKKTGKSRSRVFEKMRLLKLNEGIQKALLAGKIDASRASLIGQVADPAAQNELLEEALDDWSPLSYRDLKENIEEKYQRPLAKSGIDLKAEYDPDLIKGARGKCVMWNSGLIASCEMCSQRSGNMPLFDGAPNVCTNVACFEIKKQIVWQIKVKEAEAKGQKIMSEEEWGRIGHSSPFVRLEDDCWEAPWVAGKGRPTWGAILKGAKFNPIIAVVDGKEKKVLPRTEAVELAKKNGFKFETGNTLAMTKEEKAQELEKKKLKAEVDKRVRLQFFAALQKRAESGEKGLREVADFMVTAIDEFSNAPVDDECMTMLEMKGARKDLKMAQLVTLATFLCMADYNGDVYLDAKDAKRFGVDWAAIEKQVKEEAAKAKDKPAAKGDGKVVKK